MCAEPGCLDKVRFVFRPPKSASHCSQFKNEASQRKTKWHIYSLSACLPVCLLSGHFFLLKIQHPRFIAKIAIGLILRIIPPTCRSCCTSRTDCTARCGANTPVTGRLNNQGAVIRRLPKYGYFTAVAFAFLCIYLIILRLGAWTMDMRVRSLDPGLGKHIESFFGTLIYVDILRVLGGRKITQLVSFLWTFSWVWTSSWILRVFWPVYRLHVEIYSKDGKWNGSVASLTRHDLPLDLHAV